MWLSLLAALGFVIPAQAVAQRRYVPVYIFIAIIIGLLVYMCVRACTSCVTRSARTWRCGARLPEPSRNWLGIRISARRSATCT
jgi:hypothetical protein